MFKDIANYQEYFKNDKRKYKQKPMLFLLCCQFNEKDLISEKFKNYKVIPTGIFCWVERCSTRIQDLAKQTLIFPKRLSQIF